MESGNLLNDFGMLPVKANANGIRFFDVPEGASFLCRYVYVGCPEAKIQQNKQRKAENITYGGNKMKKKLVSMILAGCMVLAPVQMGFASETESETAVTETAEAAAEEGTRTEYPLTISTFNYEKESVEETFEKAPEKVITFWNNSLETMLALGLGDRVISAVGVDEDTILPELKDEFDKMVAGKEYNAFTDSNAAMSKEYAIMLEPDFILGWKSTFSDKTIGDVDYWHENGINTYIALNSNDISEYRTVENEYTDILTLGEIFDVQDKAQEIVDEIKDEVARVTEAVEGQEKQKVVVVEFMKDSIWNYDSTMLVGDMVKEMGGELMDLPSDIGAEDLINADPDVLFIIGNDEKVADFMADESYVSLSAVQNGRVAALDLSDVYTSGVRTIRGLNAIGKALYPDMYTE